jgi:hypothetical protein
MIESKVLLGFKPIAVRGIWFEVNNLNQLAMDNPYMASRLIGSIEQKSGLDFTCILVSTLLSDVLTA